MKADRYDLDIKTVLTYACTHPKRNGIVESMAQEIIDLRASNSYLLSANVLLLGIIERLRAGTSTDGDMVVIDRLLVSRAAGSGESAAQ